jgi:hypothetical protein
MFIKNRRVSYYQKEHLGADKLIDADQNQKFLLKEWGIFVILMAETCFEK